MGHSTSKGFNPRTRVPRSSHPTQPSTTAPSSDEPPIKPAIYLSTSNPASNSSATMAPSANSTSDSHQEHRDDQPTSVSKKSQHNQRGEYFRCDYRCEALTVFVFGASGDLAKKKTYPSLFALYRSSYLPEHFIIVGYARSKKKDDEFRDALRGHLKDDDSTELDKFLNRCVYRSGGYDSEDDMARVSEEMAKIEKDSGTDKANRLFYFAIPPSAFVTVAGTLKKSAMTHNGWARFIVEKPFGADLESFEELNSNMADLLSEDQIYRIDHYIGKEAVQNLLVMRFGNTVFEPLWNRNYVSNVMISLKENFGTKGRGGYFDKAGIIRDVMQNHLVQLITMFAMEAPVQQKGEYIRNEKVKVLQSIPPIQLEDCVLGQYVADDEGRETDYTADDGVDENSKTPTYAAMVMYIKNPRWDGVPFILRAGKALNERKSEVRVQFKQPAGSDMLFPQVGKDGKRLERNELVLRLQPEEAVYVKMNIKMPGLAGDPVVSELDLSYKSRFPDRFSSLPDAYTRLILHVLRGDSSAFVRDDELREAWRIFTPLLHRIEENGAEPIKYKAFSRGPEEFDEMAKKYGFVYGGEAYNWQG